MAQQVCDVELSACGASPSVLAALLKAGFRYKSDVAGLTARELANEANLSAKDASNLLSIINPTTGAFPSAQPITALELMQEQGRQPPISTLLRQLDHVLGGGFARSELTEICGAPGTGKTQLSLHACIAAQCQFTASSTARFAVIYIDTEGSFVVDRVAAMAESLVERRPDLASRGINRDELLRGILYFRTHDFVEQMEVMNALPEIIHSKPEVQLILVDSVTFHFRHGFEDFSQRARALDNMAALLHHIAVDYNLAVVLVNQVTSRSGGAMRSGPSTIPALGESWAHAITNRLTLSWEGNTRAAHVTKSSSLAHGTAYFIVSATGVQDDTSQ